MKRVVVWLLSLVVLLAAIVLGLASLQPERFRVERSVDIATGPEVPFPYIADFTQWVKWSPWEHVDPDLKRLFGNPFKGMGASYGWSGNDRVGEVRLQIKTARLPNGVFIDAEYKRPWRGNDQMVFKFDPTPDGTRVTWTLTGPLSFGDRLGELLSKREARMAPAFEAGLAKLKQLSEAEPDRQPAAAPTASPDPAAATTTAPPPAN